VLSVRHRTRHVHGSPGSAGGSTVHASPPWAVIARTQRAQYRGLPPGTPGTSPSATFATSGLSRQYRPPLPQACRNVVTSPSTATVPTDPCARSSAVDAVEIVDADGGLPDQPGDHLVERPVVGGDVEQRRDERDEAVVQLAPPPVLGVHDRQHPRVDRRIEGA